MLPPRFRWSASVLSALAVCCLVLAGCGKSDEYKDAYAKCHAVWNPLGGESVSGVAMDMSDLYQTAAGHYPSSDWVDGCRQGVQDAAKGS